MYLQPWEFSVSMRFGIELALEFGATKFVELSIYLSGAGVDVKGSGAGGSECNQVLDGRWDADRVER